MDTPTQTTQWSKVLWVTQVIYSTHSLLLESKIGGLVPEPARFVDWCFNSKRLGREKAETLWTWVFQTELLNLSLKEEGVSNKVL